jgi:hypothetical protein
VVGRRGAEHDIQPMDLGGADLGGATLRSADLGGADLIGADLGGADLTDARWPEDVPVPGGWKLNTDSGRLDETGTGTGPAEPT